MPKKITLADLAAKQSKLEITIPGQDKPCTFLMIKGGHTHEYRDAATSISEDMKGVKEMSLIAAKRAELFSTIIVGWDENVFGDYSKEAVIELFSDEKYEWIVDAVEVAIKQVARFFGKPAKRSK